MTINRNLSIFAETLTSTGNVTIAGGSINVQATNLISTTSSTATFATSSLPLVPAGYIQVDLNGTIVKVPYYAVWHMDTQNLINIVIGGVLPVIGWLTRQLWDAVQQLKQDLNNLELHVSENYAKKDDVNIKFDRIEQLLDKIYDKLENKADR